MIALLGTCQFLSGSPAFTQTNAFFKVPLPLTTTSSDLTGVVCARMQTGFADVSIDFMVGAAPSSATLPVTVPPLASSGTAAPPPAAADSALGASALFSSPPPHPASDNTQANPTPIQIFFIALRASLYSSYHPNTLFQFFSRCPRRLGGES